jgi:hypothetical protein
MLYAPAAARLRTLSLSASRCFEGSYALPMSAKSVHAARVGIVASLAAVVLWAIVWRLDPSDLPQQLPYPLGIVGWPLKLFLLFGCVPWALAELSDALYENGPAATSFALRGAAVSALAIAAYLPFRTAFCRSSASVSVKSYYQALPSEFSGGLPRFEHWQRAFAAGHIHLLELLVLLAFYGVLAFVLFRQRPRAVAAVVAALSGYLLLLVAPVALGLVIWDYDVFLLGLWFDSISLDLWVPTVWPNSIFLDLFLLLFFAVQWRTLRFFAAPTASSPQAQRS